MASPTSAVPAARSATQIDPASAFWFGLPEEVDQQVHPFDDYLLAVGPEGAVMPERSVRRFAPDVRANMSAMLSPEWFEAAAPVLCTTACR